MDRVVSDHLAGSFPIVAAAATTVSPRTIKVSPRNAFQGETFVILGETFRIEGPRELGLTKSFA